MARAVQGTQATSPPPQRSAHEFELDQAGDRKKRGAYYTPPEIVAEILDLSLAPLLADRVPTVLDPACGDGRFLVAAAERIINNLIDSGIQPAVAAKRTLTHHIFGIDSDPAAIFLAGQALGSLAEEYGLPSSSAALNLHTGDAFQPQAADFRSKFPRLDLVVGNPPFLTRLRRRTDFTLPSQYRELIKPYTDLASVFLAAGADWVSQDGIVCLIQPMSTIASRDGELCRQRLSEQGGCLTAWLNLDRSFDATVRVWAPVWRRNTTPTDTTVITRFAGARATTLTGAPRGGSWSSLLAAGLGVPQLNLATSTQTLADIATVTADFRDEFYYLCSNAADEPTPPGHPILTTGLVDPAHLLWGEQTIRLGGRRFTHPRLLPTAEVPGWVERRLQPKVVVATQSRSLECVVDDAGGFVPAVPLISCVANAEDLWRIAALIACPPILALAYQRHIGTGLHPQALKLAARDLRQLPLPDQHEPWHEAASQFQHAQMATQGADKRQYLAQSAELMCAAYGCSDPALFSWWQELQKGNG